MEKKLTYFVSDVHLGLQVADPEDRERRFAGFLRSLPENTEAVYLLGDIWDFWYEYKDVVPKGYVRVLSALQELMDRGVKVYFFQGNHDVWTYRYFEELGMVKLVQPCVVQIAGKRFCLGHGDGLGPVPFGYRFLRGLFHNRLAQTLFSALHPWLAFRLGNGWSRNNRLAHDVQYEFGGENEPLYKFAKDFASENEVDFFIFGHYHVEVDTVLPSGARLMILKDWIHSSPYLCFDGVSITG
ncbi:MAG: UDP-2,3-diacylglucosamine diphosphatase [Bacteroidales bacterium]|nr:UDP-2,3-diacylglucosamine diphosphatase [Bacteroidales bacterium]MBQ8573582.1 UDP-2,3-diacylglucosamine diphosphatase [Bacteroidales bacterium]